MRGGTVLAALLGLVVAVALLADSGFGSVLRLLERAGPGLTLVVGWHGVQLVCSALAWHAVARPADASAVRWRHYLFARWIREGVNNLLPVAQIGGEVVGGQLLARAGVRPTAAAAGVICDMTVEIVTELAFVLLGVVTAITTVGLAGAATPVAAGLVVATVAAVVVAGAQWFGVARLGERLLFRLADRIGLRRTPDAGGIDALIRRAWADRRAVARAAWWHLLGWALGAVEVWLALLLLGGQGALPGAGEAFTIESLGQVLKTAGFAVPGALGVQEGSYVLVCRLYGIPADVALALSLIKRVREIALGLPALLAWQWAGWRHRPTLVPADAD